MRPPLVRRSPRVFSPRLVGPEPEFVGLDSGKALVARHAPSSAPAVGGGFGGRCLVVHIETITENAANCSREKGLDERIGVVRNGRENGFCASSPIKRRSPLTCVPATVTLTPARSSGTPFARVLPAGGASAVPAGGRYSRSRAAPDTARPADKGPACEELAGLGQGKMRVTPDDAAPRKRGRS